MSTPPSSWRVLGTSVIGSSHRKSGRGCDDANGYADLAQGSLVLAVADGAGSAPRSAEGAACVVRAVLEHTRTTFAHLGAPVTVANWETFLTQVVQHARVALEAQAAAVPLPVTFLGHEPTNEPQPSGSPLADFATTLLFAVATDTWLAVAQIGDGAIVVQQADGETYAVTRPDYGEYLNETVFVTSSDYCQRLQQQVLTEPDVSGLALFTDGIEGLALNLATKEAHGPFFKPLFTFAREHDATEAELAAFLDSERVCAQTDDDKTLVLAVRTW